MEFRVELARAAEADLESLYLWLIGQAPNQGAAWFNGLERSIASLSKLPRRCSVALESFDDRREVRVLHYGRGSRAFRILFTIDEAAGVVYVLHVRRGSRRAISLGR